MEKPTWLEEDKCPHCGSKDAEPVHPFDYIKQCNKCGGQFIGSHN